MNTTDQPSARIFHHSVRVPYAHTDQMRYVYYANYLVYFEMARSEMLREIGLPYGELEARGIFLPVVEAACRYKTPAHFDDLLNIASTCAIKGVRVLINYTVTRAAPENHVPPRTIVTGHTVHACIDRTGRVVRPPEALLKLVGN